MKEVYYEGYDHTVIEKSHYLVFASWRFRKASGVDLV